MENILIKSNDYGNDDKGQYLKNSNNSNMNIFVTFWDIEDRTDRKQPQAAFCSLAACFHTPGHVGKIPTPGAPKKR